MLILVADDNEINLYVVCKLLRNIGHDVVTAGDGSEAVRMYRRHKPDLIVMDIDMPGMSGLEATILIRTYEKNVELHVPIIALTANDTEECREKSLQAGMDGYLTKPIILRQLEHTITNFQICNQRGVL